MLSPRRSFKVSRSIMLAGTLLASTLAVSQQESDENAGFGPLQSDVMVPDLAFPSQSSPSAGNVEASGPGVDTPSREVAPAIALGPAEPIAPPPVDHLSVALDWYPSPRHAALFTAQALGLFRQHGLEVDISTPADPEVPTKLLADSRVDLALTRQPLLHRQIDQGMPLVRVASLISVTLTALVVSQDSGIESLADLEGKRIGHANEDGEQILLPAMLTDSGVAVDDLDTPNVHYRIEEAIKEGRVDGVIGGVRHLLPRALANDGTVSRSFFVEEHGVPLHDGLILVANRDDLQHQRHAIKDFVAALEKATAWLLEHPDESWPLLIDQEPTLDTSINRDAWPIVRARLTQAPSALSQGRYQRFERFMQEIGIADDLHAVSRLAVDISAPIRDQ
ncbi:ABC transporter substrate-binding protein [Halomonas sp. 18H]|uniref:ABC transporter substrate-binding protein n=1 Tax=Halomonas almeriensis TaxID=308163 RepID=UPI0022307D00|nr:MULTISPECIES: ABC transporter substrate-binding protein [Halomonas]MCW4151916.1 ABC transporter substrate-binding protein [Halomonas sp. 18H]MDN3554151.1 ABC transporter substrate-binding protein [Halomonas almeriensis]